MNLQQNDEKVLLFLQKNRHKILTIIFKFFTFLGDASWFWIAGAIFLFYKGFFDIGRKLLIALAIASLVCNVIIKNIVKRTRPFDKNMSIIPIGRKPKDFSFPSGHTANAASAAAVLIICIGFPIGLCSIFIALGIAFSRLYLCVHYPSDVCTGAILGSIAGIASALWC